jgi:hypothetical protein
LFQFGAEFEGRFRKCVYIENTIEDEVDKANGCTYPEEA